MDYEKAYKEALNWMRSIYPTMQGADREDAEHYFPELKESEDEKIRKEIVQSIKDNMCVIHKDKCLAWLEKQGERTDYNPYKATIESIAAMVENYANNGDLKDFYNNVAVKCHDAIEYDKTWEKQGEQKSAWSQEDETNMDAVWRACGQAYGTDYQGILGDWLKLLKERVQLQPKQEWSEEDEWHINNIISLLEQARDRFVKESDGQYPAWITDIIWLKSFKDRVQPQPKQEWSEEDKGNLLDIKCIIDEVWHRQDIREKIGWSVEELERLWNWLDTLWQRLEYPLEQKTDDWSKEDEARYWSCLRRLGTGNFKKPETINSKWFKEHIVRHPDWKPSEEQLNEVKNAIGVTGTNGIVLLSLYNDLKKL